MKGAPDAARAARLWRIPGVTLAAVCERFGVSAYAVRKAAASLPGRASRDELILGALTRHAMRTEGPIGDLGGLASWLDYVDKDGSTAESVDADLDRLVSEGWITREGDRFSLRRDWP